MQNYVSALLLAATSKIQSDATIQGNLTPALTADFDYSTVQSRLPTVFEVPTQSTEQSTLADKVFVQASTSRVLLPTSGNDTTTSSTTTTTSSTSSTTSTTALNVIGVSGISPSRTTNVYNLHAAVNATGRAIVVWSQPTWFSWGDGHLFMSEQDLSGNWSEPIILSTYIKPSSVPNHMQVAMNDAGQAVVIWYQQTVDGFSSLFKAERSSAGVWTYPTSPLDSLSGVDLANYANPKVAINASGQAVVAFVGYNDTSHSNAYVYKIERSASGTWGSAGQLSGSGASGPDDGWNNGYDINLAMNDNGQVAVSWLEYNGDYDSLYVAERAANSGGSFGAWTYPDTTGDYWNITDGDDVLATALALNASGDVVLAWSERNNSMTESLFVREKHNGTWSSVPANTGFLSSGNYQVGTIRVALNASGKSIITWQEGLDLNSSGKYL